jgi:hypothetical protein
VIVVVAVIRPQHGFVAAGARGLRRVASFKSGFPAVMDLEFEPETGHLWAACDDTCKGQTATLDVRQGAFSVSAVYNRPSGMPDYNNEGFALPVFGSKRRISGLLLSLSSLSRSVAAKIPSAVATTPSASTSPLPSP